MKAKISFLIIAVIFSVMNFSCVSSKKYKSSQAWVEKLQSDSTATHSSLNSCSNSLKNCNAELAASKSSNAAVNKDLQELAANSQMTITAQAKRLSDMQKIINEQKAIVQNFKKSISDALVGFKPDELTVELKEGNIYVSLQEKLLFQSGSDKVNPKGLDALKKLAPALITHTDFTIDIQGYTDSVPISGKFADNWALSVARATSIARILIKQDGVDPHRIIASGRSEYYPVATNSTAEGRASNRRTEIILSPDLTNLFKLINQ